MIEAIDYLRKTIWGAYGEDKRYIIAPSRLSSRLGAVSSSMIMDERVSLPDDTSRWYLWMIGPTNAGIFNFEYSITDRARRIWKKLEDYLNDSAMVIDIYDQYGIMIPKAETFYRYIKNGSLVIAIKHRDDFKSNLNMEQVYIKHYQSRLLTRTSDRNNIKILTKPVAVLNDAINFKTTILTSDLGTYYLWKNGIRVNDFYMDEIIEGDILEARLERWLVGRYYFNVSNLKSYTSDKDRCLKYILAPDRLDSKTIAYIDDIDIYVGVRLGNKEYSIYYHHNEFSNITQLTHIDYSIKTSMVERYRQKLSEILNLQIRTDQLFIELTVRNSAQATSMVYDTHRLLDLVRLPADKRINAFTEIDNTVSFWKASALENSLTSKIMTGTYKELTLTNAVNCFGYDTLSHRLSPSPVKFINYGNYKSIELYPMATRYSTVYLYKEGLLVSRESIADRDIYSTNNDYDLAEIVVGSSGEYGGSKLYRETDFPVIDLNYSYRIYASPILNNENTQAWVNITNDRSSYTIEEGLISFTNTNIPTAYLIRQDKHHYYMTKELEITKGNLSLELMETILTPIGEVSEPMKLPYYQYQVWLNGYSLIKDLDYVINLPLLIITNKQYLSLDPAVKNKITVRAVGLNDSVTEISSHDDVGFVVNGLVSTNSKYNIRDSRNLHITVGGKLCHVEDTLFQEYNNPINGLLAINGKPYSISTIYTAMQPELKIDTLEYLKKTDLIRSEVEDYLSNYLDTSEKLPINPIDGKHTLFSPYMANLIYMLTSNEFDISDLDINDQNKVIKALEPFKEWLNYDYAYLNHYDDRYVQIQPHHDDNPIVINYRHYKVLKIANSWFFGNRVVLADHLIVTG